MKRPPFSRSRSSYAIQPKLLPVKEKAEPLPSPFPPHVHRFLFSGREIRLCDPSGANIERIAETNQSTRRQLEAVTAKFGLKAPVEQQPIKRKSIQVKPKDPNHPYHLTEAICNTLRNYADKVRKVEEVKAVSSDSGSDFGEFQTPPKPSERLIRFLEALAEKERRKQPKYRAIRCLSTERFALPRRGSHPGIWSPSTSASGRSSPLSKLTPNPAGSALRLSPEPGKRITFKWKKGLKRNMRVRSMY